MKMNMLLYEYKLRPMIQVRYRREAFVSDGIRVTVDSGVTPTLVGSPDYYAASRLLSQPFWPSASRLLDKYSNVGTQILEIKHIGAIPEWLTDFLKETNTIRASFSKYCFSTSTIVLDALNGGNRTDSEKVSRPININFN
jgi:hypothetical protein